MTAAIWVIGGVATQTTKQYSDKLVDDVAKAGVEIVDHFKKTAKLGRINRNESTFEQEGLDPEDFVQDPITKKWSQIAVEVNIGVKTPGSPEEVGKYGQPPVN
jgi:hypothetical protein